MLAAGLWLFFSKSTLAALVNVTIDDTFGDPKTGAQVTYSPGGWKNGTNCSGCAAHPDVSQVYLATVSHMYIWQGRFMELTSFHPYRFSGMMALGIHQTIQRSLWLNLRQSLLMASFTHPSRQHSGLNGFVYRLCCLHILYNCTLLDSA